MSNSSLLPPIFLVACPRSGTTLLQSLLASHPAIYSFPETKFFQLAIPSYRQEIVRASFGLISKNLSPRLQDFLENDLGRPELLAGFPSVPLLSEYTQHFLHILDQLTVEQGKQVWLEKTPEHIFRINYIQRYLPEARFVHLVRNCTDVVASLYEITRQYPERWGGIWSLDDCWERWQRCLKISFNYQDKPQHLLVKYEDLIENPVIILQDICQFLEINFSNLMLENYGNNSDHLTANSSRSVKKGGIVKGNSRKFDELFDDSQKAYILHKLSRFKIILNNY